MNLSEWVSSKKTKDMLATQAALVAIGMGILWMANGEPEKAKALVQSVREIILLIGGVGGLKIAGQAHVDAKKAGTGVG